MTIRTDRFENPAIRPVLELFAKGDGLVPVFSDSYLICPAFCDVHVHMREPGFSYKETIGNGSRAGARGGYTALCAMPNLDPVPDTPGTLAVEEEIIRRDAVIRILPYGANTMAEEGKRLSDIEGMASRLCAFSDDGRGVQDTGLMREAMLRARALGKIIAAHCEDKSLLDGGYIHDGDYARAHGHRGISSASEYKQVERDLLLAEETGVAYHICHVSTKESVELIRQAKRSGVNVTCETAPHYLVLTDRDLEEDGRFKMNPPLRSEADREALLEGIADGTVDMIATDHAPHSQVEKARPLAEAPSGMGGRETSFAAAMTALVVPGHLSLAQLIEKMSVVPASILGIEGGCLKIGGRADLAIVDPDEQWVVDPTKFHSRARNTPFAGMRLTGLVKATVCGGKITFQA